MISFIKSIIMDVILIVSGGYLKEIETQDGYSYRLMLNHITLKNVKRAIAFAPIELVLGILYIVTCSGISRSVPMRYAGGLILAGASAVLFFLLYREIIKKRPDYKLMRLLLYIYWLSFSAGGIVISASEFLETGAPYSFLAVALCLLIIPISEPMETLVLTAIITIPTIIFAISEGFGVLAYLGILAAVLSFAWISSVIYCCYSNLWIGKRQLDTAEERCSQVRQKDNLTGLLNKSGLSAKFSELAKDKSECRIAVILIDIDNFRGYNHLYGYDKSDTCLYNICNCIKIMAKSYTDIIARFGGDDFVLVIENTEQFELIKLAEQLRQGIETMALPFGEGIVTISIGVSGIRTLKDKETYSLLLNEADDQLVIAKRSGKNCIGYMGRPFIHENRKDVR